MTQAQPSGLSPVQLKALKLAGYHLQHREWPGGRKEIKTQPGETYLQAVQRIINGLPDAERNQLRGIVEFVMDYDREEERLIEAGAMKPPPDLPKLKRRRQQRR
jgi:hypothetical protein